MNDNSVNHGLAIWLFLTMLVLSIGLLYEISFKVLDFNHDVRKETRNGNLIKEEVLSTQTEYESYMGEYDGTYTLSEVLSAIENNHDKYDIYICTDVATVELHSRTYEGLSLDDYLQQGYIKEVKDVVFGGYTDTSAEFLCYLDINNEGDIQSIYYYRKAR